MTYFFNFGPPVISLELVKIDTSNLVQQGAEGAASYLTAVVTIKCCKRLLDVINNLDGRTVDSISRVTEKPTRKPRKGAAVIAASMHGFASSRKFKSPVTLTLTLDRVKVTSAYRVHVVLPAGPTT